MAVGFWNFVGAGIFGFLINMPIVSYFEIGTMLTRQPRPCRDDGRVRHAGDRADGLRVRQCNAMRTGAGSKTYFNVAFWGLNIGLAMMVVFSLFPGGVLQLNDVLENGYWHARSLAYTGRHQCAPDRMAAHAGRPRVHLLGVLPALIAVTRCYLNVRRGPNTAFT